MTSALTCYDRLNRVLQATEEGVLISEPYQLDTVWDLAAFAQPVRTHTQRIMLLPSFEFIV